MKLGRLDNEFFRGENQEIPQNRVFLFLSKIKSIDVFFSVLNDALLFFLLFLENCMSEKKSSSQVIVKNIFNQSDRRIF